MSGAIEKMADGSTSGNGADVNKEGVREMIKEEMKTELLGTNAALEELKSPLRSHLASE